MSRMRVAQVTRPDGPFEIVERPVVEPAAGEVRVKVQACGVCHSDAYTKQAMFPGIVLPRVPGHEVIGTVDALGEGVQGWTMGDRVGVGWHGGQCGQCDHCRRGDFFACQVFHRITGVTPTATPRAWCSVFYAMRTGSASSPVCRRPFSVGLSRSRERCSPWRPGIRPACRHPCDA